MAVAAKSLIWVKGGVSRILRIFRASFKHEQSHTKRPVAQGTPYPRFCCKAERTMVPNCFGGLVASLRAQKASRYLDVQG
jgi:hypothetical protein